MPDKRTAISGSMRRLRVFSAAITVLLTPLLILMAMNLIKVPGTGELLSLLGISVDEQSVMTIAALAGLSYLFVLLSHLTLKIPRD
jgi:hypothetical protein